MYDMLTYGYGYSVSQIYCTFVDYYEIQVRGQARNSHVTNKFIFLEKNV